jgi:Sec7-like guanine-nucleotide exchange factor
MLNTDLHNPMNEKKMTEQDWLKIALNVKGVT